ncbi:uncharacterized protein LOC130012814 isoform X2 [Patella vulgata]|uniref:uncharacterized protein LOC130012814 isoform X2 n=1 Tax=Patella vulgata TaxID=6465 RepID=UPI0024A7B67E|nr:uncharacterized protein LOC130012814 isoform X2 [Patella vulgata]
MFNPNVELTSRYKTEPERIEQASQELEKTRLELREKEETLQLKEDQLFSQHEERKNEVERERHKLTEAIREFQKNKSKVEKLEKDTAQHIAEQQQQTRKIIEEAVKLNKEKSQDTSVQCDVIPKDPASIKTRKLSKEGRIKDLAQQELVNRVSTFEKSRSLALEAEALEEQEESIQVQQQKVRAREKDYKAFDKSLIEELSHEKQVVGKLEAQEDQIQAYIQENKDLIKVAMDKPNPIRGGVSEMNLQSTGKKKHDSLLPLKHINVERLRGNSPKKEIKVKKSPLSSRDDLSASSSNENLQKKKRSPKNTKLTSSAEDITNRLYRQPRDVKVHKFLKKSSRHLLLNQPVRSTPKVRTPLTTPAPLILRRPPKPIINDPLKLRTFGGSDPNLARPELVRSRSRIRQISSMCNLASVPEASYEAESEAESMHSEPSIPVAVAAVRHRNKHIDISTERSRSMPTDGNFEQAWENYSQNMGLKIEPKYLNLSDSELNSPVKNSDDSCMMNLNVGRRSKKRRREIDSGPFSVETNDVDQDTLPGSIDDKTPRNQDESKDEASDDDCQRAENSSIFTPGRDSTGREEYILVNDELNAKKGGREHPNFDVTKQDQSSLHYENTESVMVFGSEEEEFIYSDENSHSDVLSDSLDDMSEDSLSGCKDDEHNFNPEETQRMDKSSESNSPNLCSPDITRASPGEENYILIGNVSDDSMETEPQNVSAININRSVSFQGDQERRDKIVPPSKRSDHSTLIPKDSHLPLSGNSSQTSKSSQNFPTSPGYSSKSLPLKEKLSKSPKDNLSISSVKPPKQHSGYTKEQSTKTKTRCTDNDGHNSGHLSSKKNSTSKSKLPNSASSETTLGAYKQRSQDKLTVIQGMVPQLELLSNSKTQDVSRQRKQQLGVYSAETNCLDQENLRNKSKFRKGTAPDLSSAGKTHTGTDDIRMMEKPELRRRSPVPEEKSCVTARKSLTKKPDHPESIGNSTNKTNIGSQKRSQKHLKPTTGETDTSDSSTEPKPTSTPKEKIRIKIKSLPNDKGITGDTTTSSNSLPTTPVKVKFKSAKPRGMVLSEENVSLSANSGSLNKSSASYSEHQSNYGAPGNEKVDENELSRSSSSVISENEPISESENGQAESSSGTTTKDSEIDSVSESDAQKSEEVGPLGIQEAANDSVIVLVPGEKRTQILGHTSHQPSKKSKSEKPYSKDNIEFNDISHTLAGLPTINTTMTGSPRAESFKSEEKYSDMEFQDVSGNSVVLKLNEEPPLYWNETQTSLIDNTNSSSNKDKTNTDPPKNANILSLGEYNFDNDDNLRKSDKSLHGDSSSNKDKTNTDPPKNANILSSGEYNFDNDDNLKKSDKSLHGEDTPLNTSLKNMTYVQKTSQDSSLTGTQSKDLYQGTSIPEVSDQSTKSLVPGNPLQKPQQPTNRFESETLSSPTDVNVLNEGDFQTTKVAALNPLKTGKTDIQNINTTVPLSWNQTQGQYVVDDNYEELISLPNKSDELSKLDSQISNNIECFKPDNQIQKQQPLTEENLSGSLHESDHFNRTGSNVQNISQDSPITGAQSKDLYQGTSIPEVSDQSTKSLVPGNKDLYQGTSIPEVSDQSTKSLVPGNPLQKPQQPTNRFESETLSSPTDVNILNEGDFQITKLAALNPLKTGRTDIQNINTTVPLSWNQTQGQYVVDDNYEKLISLPNKSDELSKLDNEIPNNIECFKPDNQIQKQQPLTEENLSGSLHESDHFNRTGSNVQKISQDSPITGAQSKDQYQGTSISEVSDQSANSLVPGNTLQKPQQPIESETLSSSSDVNALNEGDFQSSNTLPFMQAINSDRQLCPPIQSMLASEVAGQNFLKTGKTDIQNINTTVPLSWNQTQGHYIVDDNQEEIISSQNKSDKPSKLDSQIPNTTNSSKLDNQTQKQQTLRGENSSGSLNKSDHYNRSGSNIPETIQHTKQAEKLKVQTFCCEMSSIDKSGIEDVATTSDYHHIDTRGREIQQNESENSEDSRGVEEADTDYSDDSLNGAHLEGNQQPNIENETESINHTAGMENLNKPPIIATTSNTQYQNLLPEDSLMHQEPQSLVVKVDSVSSQLSNDSTADILQQNSKDQILSSNQSGSSRRQRKRAQRHQKDVKSDDTDEFSDDSLASV